MNKRNIGILSIAFMLVASVAFMMNGTAKTDITNSQEQLAFVNTDADFDGKCGDGKCGDGKATKEAKAKKGEKKAKCGDGKCGDGKATMDKSAKKSKTATKSATLESDKSKCGDGKCGDGKATKASKSSLESKSKAKKEKCGSGKCGDGK